MTRLKPLPLLVSLLVVAGCGKSNAPTTNDRKATALFDKKAPIRPEDLPPTFEISMRSAGQRVPVIMYHDIIETRGPDSVWFDCTTDEFKEQMKTIQDQGFTPISLDQLHDHLTSGKPVPDKAIVLTFDDNYQGFYDRAWPILKSLKYPAVVFVHTGYVGSKTGLHPKMTWETLQELVKDPLITIGDHTITHPNLPSLSATEQTKELTESKKELEAKLGKKINYLAYPEGKNDAVTQGLARDAGYTMAFSIVNGLAEESPSILCVNRYIHTRLEKALEDRDKSLRGGADKIFRAQWKASPVAYKEIELEKVKLAMIQGGTPITVGSDSREGVLDFINRTDKAVAGINGGFFAMAGLETNDNRMIGPCKTPGGPVLPDNEPFRWEKLRNRPLVMWGPSGVAFVPFNPYRMNDDMAFQDFMPDVENVFLSGCWLVHSGVARTSEEMGFFASKDNIDPRRRAALGMLADGTPVAAASKNSTTSAQFASALAAAGVQEAILLDSGFSTSLVYNRKVLASGHSTPDKPSRPVPHAILFLGDLDPESVKVADVAVPATRPDLAEMPKRKHKRKKRVVEPDAGAPVVAPAPDDTPPTTTPPDTTPPDTTPPDPPKQDP